MRSILDPVTHRVAVPSGMLDEGARASEHYVLRVVGDSMVEEGVIDGDFIICLRRAYAEPGEMVVAIVGDDATLKRFYPGDDGMVRLEPSNRAMKPILVPADRCRIQGIVIGLMRDFRRCKP